MFVKKSTINLVLLGSLFWSAGGYTMDFTKNKIPPRLLTLFNQFITQSQSRDHLLMASELPEFIRRSASNIDNLTYAQGHNFYDTHVYLVDEQGNRLKSKNEIITNHHYKVIAEDEPRQTRRNIWFFSPQGSDQIFDGQDDWQKCTAEVPCLNITQNIADGIHHLASKSTLWFDSGTYALPKSTAREDKGSQVIELHNQQSITGRSSNFKYRAQDDARPLFQGTFAWDRLYNENVEDVSVSSIRVNTINNPIKEFSGSEINVCLYSSGDLYIENIALNSKSASNITSNIYGQTIMISDSVLDTIGKMNAAGIIGSDVIALTSQITVKADHYAQGLTLLNNEEGEGSFIGLNKMSLQITGKSWGEGVTANHVANLLVEDVKMDISDSGADSSGVSFGLFFFDVDILEISNTQLNVNSKGLLAAGIRIKKVGDGSLTNVQVNAVNTQTSTAAIAVGLSMSDINFVGKASHIHASASDAAIATMESGIFSNRSTPPSQCSVNDEPEMDCQPFVQDEIQRNAISLLDQITSKHFRK